MTLILDFLGMVVGWARQPWPLFPLSFHLHPSKSRRTRSKSGTRSGPGISRLKNNLELLRIPPGQLIFRSLNPVGWVQVSTLGPWGDVYIFF